MKGLVNIKLGKLDGVPTARAVVSKRKMTRGIPGLTPPKPYYKDFLIVDFPVLNPSDWRGHNGKFGKLKFHMLTLVKAKLEEQTKCQMCEKGSIWFTKGYNNMYIANWYKPDGLNGEHLCRKCENWLKPTRLSFNPAPERDRDEEDYPATLDNVFMDSVNELQNMRREDLLEDIDYRAALDVQSTKQFLSG